MESEFHNKLHQAVSIIDKRLIYFSQIGLLKKTERNRWCLIRAPNNFGPTFERYVKSVFERELICHAEWGIKLEGFVDGDFDVLALAESALCYVECKIAHPDDVSNEEVRHFLQRSQDLAPEVAILLIELQPRGSRYNLAQNGAVGKPEHYVYLSITSLEKANSPLERHA